MMTTATPNRSRANLKVRTAVKAGGLSSGNHNVSRAR